MRSLTLGLAFLAGALIACRDTGKDVLPEEIVRQWQALLDQNRYEEARQLSAGNALQFVEYLNSFPHADSIAAEPTELLQLRCDVQGDSAVCSFYMEDEVGEKIPDTLVLKKVGGHWLVYEVERFEVTPLDSLREGDDKILFPPVDTSEVLEE